MDDYLTRVKELRRFLKDDWARLWKSKHEDEIKAEGISIEDFERLFVDKGEIIHATRDFKPISFREILEKHVGNDYASRVDIDPQVGGWRKFAKRHFPSKKQGGRDRPKIRVDEHQHQRKGGKGWLNKARVQKKKKEAEE